MKDNETMLLFKEVLQRLNALLPLAPNELDWSKPAFRWVSFWMCFLALLSVGWNRSRSSLP